MKKIVVFGSINMDLVAYVKNKPEDGETIFGEKFLMNHGGKGANQAVAMARLGAKVVFVGAVGNDDFGTRLLEGLQKEGIDCTHIEKINGTSSGVALITVDGYGQNSIVVVAGANSQITHMDYKLLKDDVGLVVAQLEASSHMIRDLFINAKTQNKKTILNPSPVEGFDTSILKYTDYLILNETEFEYITNQNEIQSANKHVVQDLMKTIEVPNVVLTMGGKGAYVFSRHDNIFEFLPSYKVKVVDTTAAGDSFLGGFSMMINEGKGFLESCKYAMKVGALTVQKHGAQSSLPTKKEVENFE